MRKNVFAQLEMMRKAVIALLVLIGAGPAMAEAVPRLPNEFEYWRLWAECGEPYLYGDHTTRTCMSGRIVYEHLAGDRCQQSADRRGACALQGQRLFRL